MPHTGFLLDFIYSKKELETSPRTLLWSVFPVFKTWQQLSGNFLNVGRNFTYYLSQGHLSQLENFPSLSSDNYKMWEFSFVVQ